MTALIMTKATEPSNSAITQAMPIGEVMSISCLRAAELAPELIDEAALRRAEQAPGERAEQRRHVVGHGHQLIERALIRHVGARQDPGA